MRNFIPTGRLGRLAAAAAALALAATALVLGTPWLQQLRANAALTGANTRIARANTLMSSMDVIEQDAGFSSLDGIRQAHGALAATVPALDQAANEVRQARDEAGAASGLSLLPGWYRDYLGRKRDAASIRLEQIDLLRQAASSLEQLYAAGAVIFQAQQQLDQLTGQLKTAVGQMRADPEKSRDTLKQVARSMRQIQKQLDDEKARDDFDLLTQLSQSAGAAADTAGAAAAFAGALAAGDQARAQGSAKTLVTKLASMGASADPLARWQAEYVTPRIREAAELQTRQDELDQEAARLYQP